MTTPALILLAAIGPIAVLLDLGVFNRKARFMTLPAALAWSTFWVALSLLFSGLVFLNYEWDLLEAAGPAVLDSDGQEAALRFFSAYLIEKSISLANIMVIALIFGYFRIPLLEQRRVLFLGFLGMVLLRVPTIAAGAFLMSRFDWTIYGFGILLILSAARVFVARESKINPNRNLAVFLLKHRFSESPTPPPDRFFGRVDGRRAVTPLLLALTLIVTADVMFAVDAIPGVFAVTRDPYLVASANLFALLGLRAMYIAIAGFINRLLYLKLSLSVLLIYVGVKMCMEGRHAISEPASLAVIGAILATGTLLSLVLGPRAAPGLSPMLEGIEELVWISYRQARRLVVFLIGLTVMLTGVVMIVTPGPAFVMIPLGLAILAIEFAWARRWLARLRRGYSQVEARVSRSILGVTRNGPADPDGNAPDSDGRKDDHERSDGT